MVNYQVFDVGLPCNNMSFVYALYCMFGVMDETEFFWSFYLKLVARYDVFIYLVRNHPFEKSRSFILDGTSGLLITLEGPVLSDMLNVSLRYKSGLLGFVGTELSAKF